MDKNLPPDRARDNQQKKDDYATRAHSSNDLPHDPSSGDCNCDDRQWANEQEKIAHLLKYLDYDLITADLHTHLMGMGDHSFWIDQIMRNYLFTMKDRTLESLEWYGPLCYCELPNLEIVLKNTEEGRYSASYDNYPVEMKPRNDGYHFTLHPTSDPFTFDVVQEHQNQKITKRFELSNWCLLTHVSCEWNAETRNGVVHVDAKSKAKEDWLRIGLRPDAWRVNTILNWHDLKPVPFNDELVVNILRLYRESWMNLPLSPSLCKQLMTMGEALNTSTWDWKAALNFTTDVVFDIESFQESMHIAREFGEANVLHEIIARLALSRNGDSDRYLKKYMFFNVKTQQFDYQWGITNTDLCFLMEVRNGKELEAKATLAQIRNCFTMLNVDGSAPSNSDLVHRFRRHFTPEFYPMRFKLRDPIYEQHPYTLTLLLKNVLKSYSLSRTSYVEFSLGLETLITPWIYKYLVHESIWNAIPSPEVNAKRPMMKYRFLIGFSRNGVKLPIDGELRTATDSEEAWNFLVKSPNIAMAHSFNPEAYSFYEPYFKQLNAILSCLKTTEAYQDSKRGLLSAVVGLDFVSDELGYPYCPFIQDKWLDLTSKFKLGIRLHCGEGVVREKKGPIKRAMYAHMYIMALAIRRICARGIKCRIGHGVAFQDCIIEELTEKKKSYERVPSSRLYCIPDGTRSLTPFLALISDLLVEVNITSNSYLVQHANSSSLIKLLDNWLLCTDDDGVWAPPPCAHHHRLQALEYCRAISMGYIDQDDLQKAGRWREFCFDHSEPHRREALKLEHTWTCKFHPLRAYAMISMALCIQPETWNGSVLSLGLTELLHSFGFYDGFAKFAKTIAPFAELLMDTNCWHPKDRKIQYFLRVLNPDGSIYGLLRSLFLGYDECLQLIWYERDVKALCEMDLPVPPLLPEYPNDSRSRRAEAKNLIRLSKAAAKQIVIWITCIRNHAETKSDLPLTQWMNSRLLLLDERGRSEMKYGAKYRQIIQSDSEESLHGEHSPNDEAIFRKWLEKSANNGVWKTVVEKSEKIKDLEGLILCKSRFLQPSIDADQQDKHNFFHIICNTQDQSWYIRPLPPSYLGEPAHVDTPDLEAFHTTITTDDRVPFIWYRVALSIARRLFPLTNEENPQIIRIAGVGYSGSAIAVLAGMMIATEFHHQEAVKKTSVSNEVVVWTYGGKQFGSKSFHNKVHELCAYNLEITQWRSLQDIESRTETDSLFSPPYCYLKDILVYPIGPPMIIPWDLRPSWHYFTLMLHHLPPCMEFRNEITKPNEMNIFFADDKKDLKSLAQSLYFPECTLICTHEGQQDENTDYGPLTKRPNVKVIPMDKVRISPYVWKWHPQQHKNWTDIFNLTPVQTTMRLVGDILLAILSLPNDIIISLSPNHCHIVPFATMSPMDVQTLNDAMADYIGKSEMPHFMNLMNRRDTFNEGFCLLLLDLAYLRRSSDNNSRTTKIRRQLEKAFSTTIKPFRHPESDLITNIEILLITLQNSNADNPFLHFILGQLDNMIDDLPHQPSEDLDINKFKSEVKQLLHHGSPTYYDAWKLKTEIDDAMDYYAKYKKKFDKADVGSYKSFDLALSLYFLSGEDKTQVYEVMLRQVWNVTDWLTRRIAQQDIAEVEDLWSLKIAEVQARLLFLQDEKENMSEECKYIYDVEHQKVMILTKIENANDGWKSLGKTLRSWGSMTTRKNHVLFGDALFRYFKAVNEEPPNDLSDLCSRDLINYLSNIKNDPVAPWVKGTLLYELGLIENDSSCFVEAVNAFSTVWKMGIQPKDRFSTALNAACCSARAGCIAQAVSWIGNFFEVLEIADDIDRKVALAWLEDELESKTGDFNNVLLLKQVIRPLFDDTKSRFGGKSTLVEKPSTPQVSVAKPSSPQSSQGEKLSSAFQEQEAS